MDKDIENGIPFPWVCQSFFFLIFCFFFIFSGFLFLAGMILFPFYEEILIWRKKIWLILKECAKVRLYSVQRIFGKNPIFRKIKSDELLHKYQLNFNDRNIPKHSI